MLKQKLKLGLPLGSLLSTLLITLCMVGSTTYSAFTGLAFADSFDAQIQQLQSQNNSTAATSQQLGAQAASYQDQVNQLDSQINGLQQTIVQTQQKSDDLQTQINADQANLDHQKQVLGADIKAMYLEGQVSTLEILASSNNLSDFVNKEVDRDVVQNKVKSSVDTITTLKQQLQLQQQQLQESLASLQTERSQLAANEAQQSQLLAYTEDQKAAADASIKSNNASIASLRAQQLAANRRLTSSGGVTISYSGSCGGTYPADATSAFGHWGCNYGFDNGIDSWGMYNQECVSYTAWRVYQAYGYMPYWGGSGNADEWPGDADRDHIPRGDTPQVGSVAIGTNANWFGSVGHAMWVESVNGDGTITVSQYNFGQAGQYSQMTINASLISTFIYFGQ